MVINNIKYLNTNKIVKFVRIRIYFYIHSYKFDKMRAWSTCSISFNKNKIHVHMYLRTNFMRSRAYANDKKKQREQLHKIGLENANGKNSFIYVCIYWVFFLHDHLLIDL